MSPDDVWPFKYYQWKVYSAAEAINCFKESHHPTMFNLPNSLLNVSIELNMALTKKVKTDRVLIGLQMMSADGTGFLIFNKILMFIQICKLYVCDLIIDDLLVRRLFKLVTWSR